MADVQDLASCKGRRSNIYAGDLFAARDSLERRFKTNDHLKYEVRRHKERFP